MGVGGGRCTHGQQGVRMGAGWDEETERFLCCQLRSNDPQGELLGPEGAAVPLPSSPVSSPNRRNVPITRRILRQSHLFSNYPTKTKDMKCQLKIRQQISTCPNQPASIHQNFLS